MNSIQLLTTQLKSAHELLETTISGVDETSAHFTAIGKAMPLGAAYAHAVISEDMILCQMLTHTTPLADNNAETGLSIPMPTMDKWKTHEQWYQTVKVDLAKLRVFAQKVYEATEKYISTLKESDLDEEIDIPGMGIRTRAHIISDFIIMHLASLAGEISAIKGVQGLKGYPF